MPNLKARHDMLKVRPFLAITKKLTIFSQKFQKKLALRYPSHISKKNTSNFLFKKKKNIKNIHLNQNKSTFHTQLSAQKRKDSTTCTTQSYLESSMARHVIALLCPNQLTPRADNFVNWAPRPKSIIKGSPLSRSTRIF